MDKTERLCKTLFQQFVFLHLSFMFKSLVDEFRSFIGIAAGMFAQI